MQTKFTSQSVKSWLLKGFVAHLFLVFSVASFANVFCFTKQGVLQEKITLHVQDMKIKNVLKEIEQRCAIRFGYQHRLFDLDREVSLSVDGPLIEVLNQLFDNAVSFEDMGGLVIIKRLEAGGGGGVSVPVKGKVVDEAGSQLSGVNVVEKGTSNGTITDTEGAFSLEVQSGSSILVFSFIGYESKEVTVGSQVNFEVTLKSDVKKLEEVVVVGYGTQSNRNLSTAISSVGSKDLGRQVVGSFENALQGQAAGVQVTNPSGAPGSAINISIRGANSVNLSGSPLYVIDGVPVQPSYDQEVGFGNQRPNPLSTIDPKDIESIDVLKDGASAAIYGSRASNGVVVITTKRGKIGKPQVTFNTYYGVQQLRKKIDLLNGPQFARLYNEALSHAREPLAYNPDTVKTNTDWQDMIYHSALIKNYQLSVGGGTDKTKYYVSGSYFAQDGIIRNSGFERYAVKINLDQKVTDKFRIGTSLNLGRTKNNRSVRSELALNNGGVVLGALQQIPTMPVYTKDGTYGRNPFSQSDNPYGNLLESKGIANINQLFGTLYGEYDILKNLNFRTSAGIDFRSQIENQFVTREHPGTQNSPSASRGSAATGTNTQTVWLWENTLTYRPTVNEGGYLELLGGFSAQSSDRFTSGASGFGFPSNAVPYLSAASNFNPPTSSEDEWGLISYFARANYNYKERYYLSFSMRADGSSRFDKSKRFGYFPAASVAWRVFDETFFQNHKMLSDLKIKASFGANGNQNIGNYDRFSTYGTGYNYTNYTGDGSVAGGIAPNKIGNNQITWETTYQYDAGLELSLFNNRISITADVYLKRTKNLLNNVPLSASSGAGENATVVANIGQIQNKGIELAIRSTNIRHENGLSWTTHFNFTSNRNQVLDLGVVRNSKDGRLQDRTIIGDNWIVEKGQPLGAFYGYEVQGIFQTAAEIAGAARQENAALGDLRFKDINGDNIIDEKDRKVIGNPNPKFIAGITNTFSYHAFDLSFLFQGSFGNDIYNQNRTLIDNMASPFNASTEALNAWRPDNTNTSFPRLVISDPNNNGRFSTRYVENGSYVRLKNLTLGYSFSGTALKPSPISLIRVYATAQNLLTFTKYKGYDPEVNADPLSNTSLGRDYGVYPQPRTYTLGLSITF